MQQGLRGSASAKIDDKGRLKVPTDFRRYIEENHGAEVFITSVEGDHALVYPMPVWLAKEARIAAMPDAHPVKRHFLARVNHFGQAAEIDSQGRVLIPAILREGATIEDEVVVSGRLDHLVVWNRQNFEKRLAQSAFTDADYAELAKFGL